MDMRFSKLEYLWGGGKKKKSFLLTLEVSKDDAILICIQILTTQSHSPGGTDAGFLLRSLIISLWFIMLITASKH